jgi:hypothetical protein
MSRSTPAADAVMPEPSAEPSAPEVEAVVPEVDAGPDWGNWRYLGPAGRIYTNVPVTPEPGDVITCLGIPAGDGAWEQTDADVTRQPDNWRPEPTADEAAHLRGDTPHTEG